MSPTVEQRDFALGNANERRSAHAELRRDLRDGTIALEDVLRDPHPLLVGIPIIDAVRLARNMPRTSAPAWFVRMGRDAARADVNLLMPLGSASERTRMWVAQYADYQRHGRGMKPRVAA